MSPREAKKFRALALENAQAVWGSKVAWAKLSDTMREAEIAAQACYLVLAQAMPEYARAQELLRACLNDAAPASKCAPISSRDSG